MVTGPAECHSSDRWRPTAVRAFTELAFKELGYSLEWRGKGVDEKGVDKKSGKVLVEVDPKYFRPAEVDVLVGDCSKAKKELGWTPKIGFKELVKMMANADYEKLKADSK